MIRLLTLLACLLLATTAAEAHSLRLFATVEGPQVSGYGYFVGGGRPEGARWQARIGTAVLAEGHTGPAGDFRFAAPTPVTAPVTVILDTGEGHVAQTTLTPARLGAPAAPPGAETSGADRPAAGASLFTPGRAPLAAGTAPVTAPVAASEQALAPAPALTQADVERAVERQVAPLLERIEQMDSRMRLTDLIAAVCLILGIAGIALWARGRRG